MYNRSTFPGQRGGGDGRHQPHRGRAHEPHRLLLTSGETPGQAHLPHLGDGDQAHSSKDTADNKDVNHRYNMSDIDPTLNRGIGGHMSRQDASNSSEIMYSLQDKTSENNNLRPGDGFNKGENIEAKNDIQLPGSAVKSHPAANHYIPTNNNQPVDALNTVGIPVYNNSLSHNYVYTNHPNPATNYYIPGLSEPSSPSNYPTVVMSHPGHPSHAIIFENDSRSTRNRPLPTHILLTSNTKRTKHLKPPASSKLKSKPVTIHHITPIAFPVQSSSQSALFHAPSKYALPVSHPNQRIVNINTSQQQPISIIAGEGYSLRDQRYASPPSAPVLYEEEPAPLGSTAAPPAYATIDPKKLRSMHIRPAVFKRRGVANSRQYQLL